MDLRCSVASDFYMAVSPEETVRDFSRAGFPCMELGLTHAKTLLARSGTPEENGAHFAAYALDYDLTIPQGHLDLDAVLTDQADVDNLKRWLELFYGAGVKAAVLHATGADDQPHEKQLELRSAAIRQLEAHIRGTDMVICLENLFSKPMIRIADGILELIEVCGGSEQLGICLDIGHLHRVRSHGLTEQTATEFIQKAGSRLKALHIHDNHGDLDDHLFPFTQNGLDWKEFMQALEASKYQGLFNLEIPAEAYGVPTPVLPMKLRYARQLCDYLQSDLFIHG